MWIPLVESVRPTEGSNLSRHDIHFKRWNSEWNKGAKHSFIYSTIYKSRQMWIWIFHFRRCTLSLSVAVPSMILYMDQVEIPNYERRFVTTITPLQYIDISILIYENKHILSFLILELNIVLLDIQHSKWRPQAPWAHMSSTNCPPWVKSAWFNVSKKNTPQFDGL